MPAIRKVPPAITKVTGGRPWLGDVCPVSPGLKGFSLRLGESIPICYRSPCLLSPPLQRSPANKSTNKVSIIN